MVRTWAALLLFSGALAGCTAGSQDPDGDGLSTATEVQPAEIRVRTANGTELREVTSDPEAADTDGDGLSDREEAEARTDPRDVDTDLDGLLDGPDLADPPADLRALLEQRGIVSDPAGRFLGELALGTKGFDWDGDRPFPDGLGDGEEVRGWTVQRGPGRAVRSDPSVPDTEGDGLSDLEEQRRGCDPSLPDTDADGAPDALDTDCARDARLRLTVPGVNLTRAHDPAGTTDLLVEVQAAGQFQNHTQEVAPGERPYGFAWTVDVPDEGAAGSLVVQVVLAFWDRDLPGDDAASGRSRQEVLLAGTRHTLAFGVDLFRGAWTSDRGFGGSPEGRIAGDDGEARVRAEAAWA